MYWYLDVAFKEDARRVFDAKKRIFRAGIGFLKNDIFAKGGSITFHAFVLGIRQDKRMSKQ